MSLVTEGLHSGTIHFCIHLSYVIHGAVFIWKEFLHRGRACWAMAAPIPYQADMGSQVKPLASSAARIPSTLQPIQCHLAGSPTILLCWLEMYM